MGIGSQARRATSASVGGDGSTYISGVPGPSRHAARAACGRPNTTTTSGFLVDQTPSLGLHRRADRPDTYLQLTAQAVTRLLLPCNAVCTHVAYGPPLHGRRFVRVGVADIPNWMHAHYLFAGHVVLRRTT